MIRVLSTAALILCLLAVIVIIWDRWRVRRLMDSLEKMLEEAANGTLTESSYDETRLSRLETMLVRFLNTSLVSARSISEEKDRIKELIADISHQTKTPIANLCLYSELLMDEGTEPSQQKEYLTAINSQAEKLRFLIDSLVKLSRLENGIMVLSASEGEILPLLEEVCAQLEPKAEAAGLELNLIPPESKLRAVFDAKWTAEALHNLVDNAIKYTPSGSVTVSARAYELFVRIDVSDTGIGIPEEEQAQVFSRFYRSGGHSSDMPGVGLGLFLAREIVSLEGGYIRLSSKPGKGSVFSVFLPGER